MRTRPLLIVFCLMVLVSMNSVADSYQNQRRQMIAEIIHDVRETEDYTGRSALDERVMDAIEQVPRHEFVPEAAQAMAYQNRPLPIGHGQTISQPYIVALMTDLLKLQSHHVVLEVGTGSGYQAAVLSVLADRVFTIEIIPALADSARATLARLAFNNVVVRAGDGYQGWPEHAPFDAIIVTAGGDIPPKLVEQLRPGGRMIIPVGDSGSAQYLTLLEKTLEGSIESRRVLPVRFVPLIGGD